MAKKYLLVFVCLCLFCLAGCSWIFLPSLKGIAILVTTISFFILFICVDFIVRYKAVKFTPDYIMVNSKKIDITQLALIKFVKYRKSHTKNSSYTSGIEFMMRFKAESGIKKDILFIMLFGGFFTIQPTYNYTDRFIKVIWSWVAAKK